MFFFSFSGWGNQRQSAGSTPSWTEENYHSSKKWERPGGDCSARAAGPDLCAGRVPGRGAERSLRRRLCSQGQARAPEQQTLGRQAEATPLSSSIVLDLFQLHLGVRYNYELHGIVWRGVSVPAKGRCCCRSYQSGTALYRRLLLFISKESWISFHELEKEFLSLSGTCVCTRQQLVTSLNRE